MPRDQTVTLVRGRPSDTWPSTGTLPPELVAQLPRRLQILGGLFFVAFALDPLILVFNQLVGVATDSPLSAEFVGTGTFRMLDVCAALASAGLFLVARNARVRPTVLHAIGLAYAILICFETALVTNWQFFLEAGVLPNLTWVPVIVIVFPLVLPGPPRRMTVAAVVAASMSPLAIGILQITGRVTATVEAYVGAGVASAFAVVFAVMGARLIYGLGRQVTVARELGSYRLEAVLGTGGMGEVWKASHRLLARPAAIKLIRPELAGAAPERSSDARVRFEREAQAIALLRSPHTVEIYDFGVTDEGVFYYAMELLDGLDVMRLVERFGALPHERVTFILAQVCHSLSEAHLRGLVHRDIKPANIVLCRYGEDYDFVKVLDFGLVTALRGTVDPGPEITREHPFQGTPSYISPEQAMGRSDVDNRADVYATGCVAYWLLTGHRVFSADSAAAMLIQHATAVPVPPSERTELPIPPALDRLVLRCLSKQREERPQSARELSDLLTAIQPASPWDAERARQWWELHGPDLT